MKPSARDFRNAAENRAKCSAGCHLCSPVAQMRARLRMRRFSARIDRIVDGGVACDHVIFPGTSKAQVQAIFRRILK